MAPGSLAPAFVQIGYSSAHGEHVMTRPTRAWSPPAGSSTAGFFDDWVGGQIDANVMIEALVDLMADLMATTSSFDYFIIYTQADADSEPIIAHIGTLTAPGTVTASAQDKGTQAHYALLDTGGAKCGITLMDMPLEYGFERKNFIGSLATPESLMIAEFTADTNGWSSRKDGRPVVFKRATYDMNDALRKRYRMT
jgi:hypothetical protein